VASADEGAIARSVPRVGDGGGSDESNQPEGIALPPISSQDRMEIEPGFQDAGRESVRRSPSPVRGPCTVDI